MATGHLVKKIRIKGTIQALTGLHIGGTNAGISIGGADATVVRNPVTNQPYIPGSSLKGKMRSLLEKFDAVEFVKQDNTIQYGPALDIEKYDVVKIFGTMPKEIKKYNAQPITRLIVRDCLLTQESEQKLKDSPNTDMPYTEVKTEVVIDRITSAATPRPLERVPATPEFDMENLLNIHDGDDEEVFIRKVLSGLLLVQNDYLGGKGTRGSGQVKIAVDELSYKDAETYKTLQDWKEYQDVTIPAELQ